MTNCKIQNNLKAKNVKGVVHSPVGVPYTFKYVTIK